MDHDAFLAEPFREDGRDVGVLLRADVGGGGHDRDLRAEAGEGLAELGPDRAAAHDEEGRGELPEVEDGLVREVAGLLEAGEVGDPRARAGRDDDVARTEDRAVHLDLVGGPQAPRAEEDVDAEAREALDGVVRRDEACGERTQSITAPRSCGPGSPAPRTPKRGASRACCAAFAARSSAFEGTQPYWRQSPPIARTRRRPRVVDRVFLDEGDARPEARAAGGDDEAAGARPHHDEVVVLHPASSPFPPPDIRKRHRIIPHGRFLDGRCGGRYLRRPRRASPGGLCHSDVRDSRRGRLAQLVEHLPYTQDVIGSSPVPPTRLAADAGRPSDSPKAMRGRSSVG